jgi:uncharacterized protein YheU (UPF0270 family)
MTRHALLIPPEQLSADALQGVIEAFVMREGTDYGEMEQSFAEKTGQVGEQLRCGDAVIVFDLTTESCTLMTRQGWRELQRQLAEDA